MAFTIEIPITDHYDLGVCTNFYEVKVRLDGVTDWTVVYPFSNSTPVKITGLLTGQKYNVEIRRVGCNGEYSEPQTTDVDIP